MLAKTKMFRNMSAEIDEDEHSLEMHYPYIRHVWSRRDVRVVPILVGSLSPSVAEEYAKILQPFAADPNTMFIVSSDFCHWGLRFRYTRYQAGSRELPVILNALTPPDVYAKYPIHASITDLDTEAMSAISFSSGRASIACQVFHKYIQHTRNTVCGRHPIFLLLSIMTALEIHGQSHECRFTYYTVCILR